MKREELITYKMLKRIHESPDGLTRLDFPELRTDQVHNYMKDYVRRGLATAHKVGSKMNRYTVSAEQWAIYSQPRTPTCRPRTKSVVGDGSLYGLLLTMASRPGGVSYKDPIKGYHPNTVSTRLSKLAIEGRLIRVKTAVRKNQYFYDQAAADAFQAAYVPKPKPKPKPKPYVKVHKAKIQKGSAFPATVKFRQDTPKHAQTKESARAKWNATQPHYPTDVYGNPTWKFTACPGFTADPRYSNTHSQIA
jgi:hypothetical protein